MLAAIDSKFYQLMEHKIKDSLIRLIGFVLLLVFQTHHIDAQQKKELWLPYTVSAQLDTANLPYLTSAEKELQIRNKREEEKQKIDIENSQARFDSLSKKMQEPEYKAMRDSEAKQVAHMLDSMFDYKMPTREDQE